MAPESKCGTRADWEGMNPYEHMQGELACRVVFGDFRPYCLMSLETPQYLKCMKEPQPSSSDWAEI